MMNSALFSLKLMCAVAKDYVSPMITLLSLYNAKSWNRDTGEQPIISQYQVRVFNF